MGTTYSLTVGWGFQLTDNDIDALAKHVPKKIWEDYGSPEEFLAETGAYEVLEYVVGYGTKLDRFDADMSVIYDYYDHNPYYIYLKSATTTYYGSGFKQIPPEPPELTEQEAKQAKKLAKWTGRKPLELVPFAEMSIG